MPAPENLSWTLKSTMEVPNAANNLVLKSSPVPTPGPGEALLAIAAVSLNYRDVMITMNSPDYPVDNQPSVVPCSDAAGTIVSVGPGSRWAGREGTRVVIQFNNWKTLDVRDFQITEVLGAGHVQGTLRRYMTLPDDRLISLPDNLSMEEAAALPCASSTALNTLLFGPEEGKPAPGRTILTQGTGGVSCSAIQMASALGATVIATSSSDERLELAKKLGAKHVINYKKTPNWDEEVKRLTNGQGVDHVVDVAGASTLPKSLKSARYGGLVSVMGFLSGSHDLGDLMPDIIYQARMIRGVLGGGSKPMFEEVVKIFGKHDLHPVIAKVFDFQDAPKAFEAMEKGDAVGKLVIKVN